MPRKKRNVILVQAFPDLGSGLHTTRIVYAGLANKGRSVLLGLENMSPGQQGRYHEVEFSLPARPTGPLASVLCAAGHRVEVGTEIDLDTLVGAEIAVRFKPGTEEIIGFQPIKETEHEHA